MAEATQLDAGEIGREFNCELENGVLPEMLKDSIMDFVKQFGGKKIVVKIKEWRKPRSAKQNKYMFGIIGKYLVPVYREGGNDWDAFDIHECIMAELGYTTVVFDPKGRPYRKRMHSSDFNTMNMEEYLSRFRAYCSANLGVFIPLPNEQEIKLYNLKGF